MLIKRWSVRVEGVACRDGKTHVGVNGMTRGVDGGDCGRDKGVGRSEFSALRWCVVLVLVGERVGRREME